MFMPMAAEDVVVGIFRQIKQHNKAKLTADRETLHKIFYDIKIKYPEIMSVFTFREREQFPESSQLDQALSNLDAAGLISRQNFTPRYYSFEDPLERSYNKFSKKILSDAGIYEEQLDRIAAQIELVACGKA
ncbi:MAG: hypothetical protein A2X82_12840 [Geobacteraceae bacterium GWC2_55_20]|nr:MAG: hypothetical protein A2X82_12840 [Geobacteraceae bacterium GWC2_55_20]OGU21663.1 MAG: hypothetical protein A2X85_15340 [Geobacteraceae bacterium GWF2_54_21]HBA71881.1 hypothetical protein [Geobacter sp.]HCE68833.1 hypothetical protein [Geobacter sp.]